VYVDLSDERGQRDGRQRGGVIPSSAHLSDQIEAIVLWHTEITHQHLWSHLSQHLDRLLETSHRRHDRTGLFQDERQDSAGVGFIVDDQYAKTIQPDEGVIRRSIPGGTGTIGGYGLAAAVFLREPDGAHWEANRKRRSLALSGTRGFNRPTVRFHDVPDNRQPQPQSGELA
jgi:hypothetical protein